MIELLKNCSHGNEVSTYLMNNNLDVKKIIKVAATPIGIKNLKCEIEGWDWYQKIRYSVKEEPLCRIVQERNSYLKIHLRFIEGARADCRKGLEENEEIIKKVIKHYCEIWPYYPDDKSPLHGDLSLDNIIYNDDGIHIIDWEHFNIRGAQWGFDPLYMLFETLFLRIRNRKRPSQKEIAIIVNSMNLLNRTFELQPRIINHPLKFLIGFITDNYTFWGGELSAFRNKLPILAFTPDRVTFIDHMIYSGFREQT